MTRLGCLMLICLCACSTGTPRLEVFAASSLTDVFEDLAPSTHFEFAGSDDLAAQIEHGATPDVYAAATTTYPDELHDEGLLDDPVAFATNELVVLVPRSNPAGISSLKDLARPGVRVVMGAPGVPAGDYARSALEELRAKDILDNVVSEEDDVKGVVAKVALGEADAGFAYRTDAAAASDDVTVITLPQRARPRIVYEIGVVTGTDDRDGATQFVDLVTGARGRAALQDVGFGVP
ncbi:MAG TPA: molybdate ABC transporter substrate-binding protein [Actinomycetota bacterium]|nr:molybdate ABC transporter substrate-binding protein [Actinomycetota bacterium]